MGESMVIDSHVHIKGGDTYRREFDPDATVRMLDAAGIDRACVFSICRRHPNLWLDTSYSHVPWKIRDAVRCCGAEKVVFGCDGGAGYYPSSIELAKIHAYDFPPEDLRLILGGNIARLLHLEPHPA